MLVLNETGKISVLQSLRGYTKSGLNAPFIS